MPIKRLKNGQYDVSVCVNRQRVHRLLPKGATASDAKKLPAIPGDPRLVDLMANCIRHADTLRGPKPARYAAQRIGRWVEGYTASQARQVAATICQDMAGAYKPGTINKSLGTLKKALSIAYERACNRPLACYDKA